MGNYYNGATHRYGLVWGSLYEGAICLVLTYFAFKEHNFISQLGIISLFLGIGFLIDWLYHLIFGNKIKYSFKKKPKDFPLLYKVINIMRIVAFILVPLSAIIIIIINIF